MKKTILLALLAGSMLASCATAAKVDVNNAKADPLAGIIEDTDAHEELFENLTAFGPKRASGSGIVDASEFPIGIQHFEETVAGVDYVSIRFVAAIDTDSNYATTKAYWHRHIYNASGTEVKTVDGEAHDITTHEVTKGYTQLNSAGGNLALPGGFDHFVVYTIRNIPVSGVSSAADYYILASLELDYDGDGTADDETKVLATTADQKTRFTFAADLLDSATCFGVKKTAGGFTTVAANSENYPNATSGNFAQFTGLVLNDAEGFLVARYTGTSFHVYGQQSINWSGGNALFAADGTSNFTSPIYDRTTVKYSISANEGTVGRAYIEVSSIRTTLYLTWTSSYNWWNGSGDWSALYTSINKVDTWYPSTSVIKVEENTTHYVFANVDICPTMFIFCRMGKVDSSSLDWSNVNNQTYDCSIMSNVGSDLFTINNQPEAYGKLSGAWGTYPAS